MYKKCNNEAIGNESKVILLEQKTGITQVKIFSAMIMSYKYICITIINNAPG